MFAPKNWKNEVLSVGRQLYTHDTHMFIYIHINIHKCFVVAICGYPDGFNAVSSTVSFLAGNSRVQGDETPWLATAELSCSVHVPWSKV